MSDGTQVDRALERVVEQRREGPRIAVDRVLRAVVRRRTGPGCRPSPGCPGRGSASAAGSSPRERCWRRPPVAAAPRAASGSWRAGSPPKRRRKSFGPKLEPVAARRLERRRDRRRGRRPPGRVGLAPPPSSEPAKANCEQLVGLSEKFGAVELHRDRADVEQGAAVDVRDRVGDRAHLGGARVDEQRHPHHDRAEVERPGRGGGDRLPGRGGRLCRAPRGRPCRRSGAARGRCRRRCRRGRSGSRRGSSRWRPRRRRCSPRRRRARPPGSSGRRRASRSGPAAGSTSTPFSSWLPSERAMSMCSGLKAPAPGLAVPAPKPGAKGRSASVFAQSPPPGAAVSVKSRRRRRRRVPGPGTSSPPCVVVFGPQVGGLVSAACGPSSKSSRNELNGTCGRPSGASSSSKVVVSCPVSGIGADVADQARRDAVAGRLERRRRSGTPRPRSGSRLSCWPT